MAAFTASSPFVPGFIFVLLVALAPSGEAVVGGPGAFAGAPFGRRALLQTSVQERILADHVLEAAVMQEDLFEEEFADDIEDDESAFVGFQRPVKSTNPSQIVKKAAPSHKEVDKAEELQGEGWEAQFMLGVEESKIAVDGEEELSMGSWAVDRNDLGEGSGAGVPAQMLKAEALMLAAETAPAAMCKEKTAERALRLYYHARWLAERNYARAAEWRYRESARLARRSRRSVLGSHSLARLGYFLLIWGRLEEAREVLAESMQLNTKSNPLALYLHGVLERQVAGADLERLLAAEDHILQSAEQPSEDLELERQQLISEIGYWREAELTSRNCFANSDAAQVLICLSCHAAQTLAEVCR